jgi:hypothetical protein
MAAARPLRTFDSTVPIYHGVNDMKRITTARSVLVAASVVAAGLFAACGDASGAVTTSSSEAVCADDQLSEFVPGSRHMPVC